MRIHPVIRASILIVVLPCAALFSRPALDKREAVAWYAKYSSMVRWVGYQGSDQEHHFYIARVMDTWTFIQIRKDELTVADERPRSRASSGPLYHYLVDPKQDYKKVEK